MADANVIRNFFVALGFKTNDAEASKMQSSLLSMDAKAKQLNKTLVDLVSGAVHSVAKTAKELDKLYYASQRTGASASNIQAFGDAISQMGGDAESAVASLESFARKIRNSPDYESMIQGLGVVTRDQNDQIRDRVEVFKDLSKTLSSMPYYQANAHAQSLGVDEKTLIAMRDGSFLGNMEKYQKLRKEMGITDDLAESGKEFMFESRELGITLKAVSQVLLMTLGKTLLPILKLVNSGTQGAIRWFNDLDPAIKNVFTAGMKLALLTLIFNGLFRGLFLAGRAASFLFGFSRSFGVLRFTTHAVTLVFKKLGGILGRVMRLLAFTPIGRAIALIGMLVAAIRILIKDYEKWKEGGKSLIDWSKWIDGIDTVINKIKDFIALLDNIKDNVINFVKKVIDDPVGAIQDVTVAAKDALTGVVEKAVEAVKDTDVVKAAQNVGGAVVEGVGQAGNWFSEQINKFIDVDQIKPNSPVKPVVNKSPVPLLPTVKNQRPKNPKDLTTYAKVQEKLSLALNNITNKGIGLVVGVAKAGTEAVKDVASVANQLQHLGSVSAKYEGKIDSANKDVDQNGNPAGWAYGKFQFNSAKGGLQQFFADNPDIEKRFEGLNPGTKKFNDKWKELAQSDPVGFEGAQNKSAANLWFKPAEKAYSKAGFDLQNRGVQEAVFSSSIQHGGVIRKLLPLAQKMAGKEISELTAKEQIELIYKARTKYHSNGKKRYDNEVKDALKLSNQTSFTSQPDMLDRQFNLLPTGNPYKSQINNSSSMTARSIVVNQNFKTDMVLNGVSSPLDSAKAVKRQQEASLAIMARNAQGNLV